MTILGGFPSKVPNLVGEIFPFSVVVCLKNFSFQSKFKQRKKKTLTVKTNTNWPIVGRIVPLSANTAKLRVRNFIELRMRGWVTSHTAVCVCVCVGETGQTKSLKCSSLFAYLAVIQKEGRM